MSQEVRILNNRYKVGTPSTAALGFFDGIHKGHLAVIGNAVNAAKKDNISTIIVTFTHPSWKIKNGVPCKEITTEGLKEKILASIGVDAVVLLDFDKVKDLEPFEFIDNLCRDFNIKYLSTGFNYHFGKAAAGGKKELIKFGKENGIGVSVAEPVRLNGKILSSTAIRTLVSKGEVERAAEMLSRPFGFYGEVVHGKQLGRTLGIPTINQVLSENQLLPKFGVYASLVKIDGKTYPGVTNVGVKPTVSNDKKPLSETHILDYHGDLYGKFIQVDLIRFVRPEMKFCDISHLKEQMQRDSLSAKEIIEEYNKDI